MLRSKLLSHIASRQLSNVVLLKLSPTCASLNNVCRRNVSESVILPRIELTKATNKSEEREYLVRLKTDPDTFGTPEIEDAVDEGDLEEERFYEDQPLPSQRLRTKQYADMIKDLINKRQIKEAIDLVEVRMIKEDRVKPESYIYSLLIGACGRLGYTKKAFQLYNDMKRRGLKVHAGAYTALFNACANSPWPETDGLTRAKKLYQIMIEKGYEPNDTNYNAMIKAFGRCGDLNTAFTIVDEMMGKGLHVHIDTVNFLLQGCITDKDAGFRHALLVWRKLVDRNIKPNIFTYNLIIRSIRDCGLGDLEVMEDVINQLVPLRNKMIQNEEHKLLTAGEQSTVQDYNSSEKVENEDITNVPAVNVVDESVTVKKPNSLPDISNLRPNLMAKEPHLGNIISLSEITKPEERLLLVGGCKEFLKNMQEHGCVPDIKTFTLLLDAIPGSLAAEQELLSAMRKLKVKPDLDFYNMLIKKRSMRFDYESAKEVVGLIYKHGYKPDVITYGVLSLGCKTKEEAAELIEQMRLCNYRLNPEILGTMLRQACCHVNFKYVMYVMDVCDSEGVQPNKMFIETLDKFKRHCRELESMKKLSPRRINLFCNFRAKLKEWKGKVKIDDSEDAHPWQQFRQETEENKYYKGDGIAKFKPRRQSVFKIKTSPKHYQNRA